MIDQFTWFLTRGTGLLAWALLAVATIWGLLLSSRVLERRPSPAWLLDLHRHLGLLTVVLTTLHVGAILVDDFVDYTVAEVLVPFASDLDRIPVALGVLSLWLLVLVQGSSWVRGRLSPRTWRVLHVLSAPLVVIAAVHGWSIGTDADNPVVLVVALVLIAELVLLSGLRVRYGRRPLPVRG